MDTSAVPANLKTRRVVEIDKGLKDKPPMKHALEG